MEHPIPNHPIPNHPTPNLPGAVTWAPEATLAGAYTRACQRIHDLEARLRDAETEVLRLTEVIEVAQALLAFPMPGRQKRR